MSKKTNPWLLAFLLGILFPVTIMAADGDKKKDGQVTNCRLLKTHIEGSQDIDYFRYSANGKLILYKRGDSTKPETNESFRLSYNKKGQLTEFGEIKGQECNYSADGKLSWILNMESSPFKHIAFFYNKKGQVIKRTEYEDEQDSFSPWYSLYTYDERGNVVKAVGFDNNELQVDSAFYEYDTQKNYQGGFPNYIFFRNEPSDWGPNNAISGRQYSTYQAPFVFRLIMEYNVQGYPVKFAVETNGKTERTYSLFYYCR